MWNFKFLMLSIESSIPLLLHTCRLIFPSTLVVYVCVTTAFLCKSIIPTYINRASFRSLSLHGKSALSWGATLKEPTVVWLYFQVV